MLKQWPSFRVIKNSKNNSFLYQVHPWLGIPRWQRMSKDNPFPHFSACTKRSPIRILTSTHSWSLHMERSLLCGAEEVYIANKFHSGGGNLSLEIVFGNDRFIIWKSHIISRKSNISQRRNNTRSQLSRNIIFTIYSYLFSITPVYLSTYERTIYIVMIAHSPRYTALFPSLEKPDEWTCIVAIKLP